MVGCTSKVMAPPINKARGSSDRSAVSSSLPENVDPRLMDRSLILNGRCLLFVRFLGRWAKPV